MAHPLSYNIILLGKTGSGKSASGNTLLKRNVFTSKQSLTPVTREVQVASVTIDGVTLNVCDTPGQDIFNAVTSAEITTRPYRSLLELDESARTVILLVIKAEKVASEEKQDVYPIADGIPEWLAPNTWILFTKGDALEKENLTVEQFIEETEEVKELLKRIQNRYHVFNNFSQSPNQVRMLMNKITAAPEMILPEFGLPQITSPYPEKDPLHRRITLVGKTGVGKSATGNTILGEKRFQSEFSSSSITSECELHQAEVSGRNISVIDTPGLFDTRMHPEKLEKEIGRSFILGSPGPHAFLYVLPVNNRFTEQEENVVQKLEMIFGREMKKYTIVLFTYGDLLEKPVDMLIQENRALSTLVGECGGGYHVINNEELTNRDQVSELLEKIDRMVEKNGGTCYSNQLYGDAYSVQFSEMQEEEEEETGREEIENPRQEEGEETGREEIENPRQEEGEETGREVREDELSKLREEIKSSGEKLKVVSRKMDETEKLRRAEGKKRSEERKETERCRKEKEEKEEQRKKRISKREDFKGEERNRNAREDFDEFYTRNMMQLSFASNVARSPVATRIGCALAVCFVCGVVCVAASMSGVVGVKTILHTVFRFRRSMFP